MFFFYNSPYLWLGNGFRQTCVYGAIKRTERAREGKGGNIILYPLLYCICTTLTALRVSLSISVYLSQSLCLYVGMSVFLPAYGAYLHLFFFLYHSPSRSLSRSLSLFRSLFLTLSLSLLPSFSLSLSLSLPFSLVPSFWHQQIRF